MPRQTYTAGEAARRLGISLDTLRRWDREGKLRVERDSANRRVVPVAEVERLRGEETFSSVEALVAQIRRDADQARALLAARS